MKLKVRLLGWSAGRPAAILNIKTAERINIHVNDRILIKDHSKKIIAVVDVSDKIVKKNELAISSEIRNHLRLKSGEKVNISLAEKPESNLYIYKKLNCETLSKKEIYAIVKDIVSNALTEVEIAYFVSAVYKCGMSMKEIDNFIDAITSTGNRLSIKSNKIVDKHSIGGIAGNRTTPIVVSICASAGLIMPKTSSRAITSAAGTADAMETIANVNFNIKQIEKIIKKTNACIVWGGALGLAPADDKIIRIERVINVDPECQLLASILSKKLSVGSKYVLIDIPYGKFAKVDKKRAVTLKKKFEKIANHFKLKIKVVLTKTTEPIGNGVGPVLEMRGVLSVLKNESNAPKDLKERALFLSGELLELAGRSKKGKGKILAQKILESGKAFEKFKQIIKAQKGSLSPNRLKLSNILIDIKTKRRCKIIEINNQKINHLARIAGSPMDKSAGVYLYAHLGDILEKGEKIITIYAESKDRLKEAINFYRREKPIKIR